MMQFSKQFVTLILASCINNYFLEAVSQRFCIGKLVLLFFIH